MSTNHRPIRISLLGPAKLYASRLPEGAQALGVVLEGEQKGALARMADGRLAMICDGAPPKYLAAADMALAHAYHEVFHGAR